MEIHIVIQCKWVEINCMRKTSSICNQSDFIRSKKSNILIFKQINVQSMDNSLNLPLLFTISYKYSTSSHNICRKLSPIIIIGFSFVTWQIPETVVLGPGLSKCANFIAVSMASQWLYKDECQIVCSLILFSLSLRFAAMTFFLGYFSFLSCKIWNACLNQHRQLQSIIQSSVI